MSRSQCYHVQCTPTVYPADPFNAKDDAEILRSTMCGPDDIDEQVFIDVFTHRATVQRLEIVEKYKTMYSRNVVSDFNFDLLVNNEVKQAITALTTPFPQYYAKDLREAITDFLINEDALIEILVSLSNSEIKAISAAYKELYRTELKHDIKGVISGHLQKFLISLTYAERDENPEIDEFAATKDVEALLKIGEENWATEESTFNSILITRSFPQLRKIFEEYERIAGRSIEKAIKRKRQNPIEDCYLAVVKCARDKTAFFAERLHKAISGWGTNFASLNRIIITRSEIDLGDIKEKYQEMYGRSLADDIYEETSDNYRKLLLNLLG